jgi:hypothetical protein
MPAICSALDQYATALATQARRLRVLAQSNDALAAHLLCCPEGDDAARLVWQRQYAGLVQENDRAGGAVMASSATAREAWATWEQAFAEGA